jgi:hypothetical protein
MLLHMVQHPWLRGSLAIKIKRQTIKAAIQLLKHRALARLRISCDYAKEVKSISFLVRLHVSIPSHICPLETCAPFHPIPAVCSAAQSRKRNNPFCIVVRISNDALSSAADGPLLCSAQ